jgi:hypothetical protein
MPDKGETHGSAPPSETLSLPLLQRDLLGLAGSAGEPDGALLLHHLHQSHPGELTPFLDQMHTTDDITPAIVQAYEMVEEG